jgi:hypothetical protein
MPRRTKKRCSPATDTCRPTPISAWRNSSSEMSLRSSQTARISAPRCSTRRERLSPPCGLGAKLPVSRRCACQRIASPAPHQSEPPPPGNSSPHQSPQEAAGEDPSIVVGPSMPASFTSTDPESEITAAGNPLSIQTGRKTL